MGKPGEVSIKALSVLACVVLAGCDRDSGKESRSTEMSGPAGTEHSLHPRFKDDNRLTIASCCAFDVGRTQVTKLEGDVDGRLVEGRGFRIEISFGNGLARTDPPGISAVPRNVDGVALKKFETDGLEPGKPKLTYTAIIPLDAEAQRRRIKYPGLEVRIWCGNTDGCRTATQIIEGVRF